MQLYGAVVTIAWSVVMTAIIMKSLDMLVGVRVALEEELIGLDIVVHGAAIWGVEPPRGSQASGGQQLEDTTIKRWMAEAPILEEEPEELNEELSGKVSLSVPFAALPIIAPLTRRMCFARRGLPIWRSRRVL